MTESNVISTTSEIVNENEEEEIDTLDVLEFASSSQTKSDEEEDEEFGGHSYNELHMKWYDADGNLLYQYNDDKAGGKPHALELEKSKVQKIFEGFHMNPNKKCKSLNSIDVTYVFDPADHISDDAVLEFYYYMFDHSHDQPCAQVKSTSGWHRGSLTYRQVKDGTWKKEGRNMLGGTADCVTPCVCQRSGIDSPFYGMTGNGSQENYMEITVRYAVKRYKINWNLKGGRGLIDGMFNDFLPAKYESGKEFLLDKYAASKDGSKFLGWKLTTDGSSSISDTFTADDCDTKMPSTQKSDVTLNAIYSSDIKFEVDTRYFYPYDSSSLTKTYIEGKNTNVTFSEPLPRPGYNFTGWSASDVTKRSNTEYTINSSATGAISFSSNWAEGTYNVTWNQKTSDNINATYNTSSFTKSYKRITNLTMPAADKVTIGNSDYYLTGFIVSSVYNGTSLVQPGATLKNMQGNITVTPNVIKASSVTLVDNDGGNS